MHKAIVAVTVAFCFFSSTSASSQTGAATTTVPMEQQGGTYVVPVLINDAIKLDFIVDSGASDVSVPADVVLTLLRTRTILTSDFIGKQTYVLADGSKVPSVRFRLRSLKVGNLVLENVIAGLAPADGSLLLGQSFLGRFQSWSINNSRHELVLNGCCLAAEAKIASAPEAASRELAAPAPRSTASDMETRLQDASRDFVFALYRQMSSSNDQATATLLNSLFAETVDYFGSELTRFQVVDREMKFLARWPIRLYRPKNGAVFAKCDVPSRVCSVSGVLEFDARSVERNQRSTGEATFEYLVQFSSTSTLPKIILEKGTVLKRTTQVLSSGVR